MNDEEARAWAKDVVDKSRPDIADSANFCSIVTEGYLNDPLCATQFGMAVFMDKPIILMVQTGTKLPKNLEKLAAGIIYFQDQNDLKNASVRFKALMDKIEREREQH